MTLILPPDEIIEAINSGFTTVTARADIYEADTITPWMLDAPLLGGSISVDGGRDERRTASVELENINGKLKSRPGGFWYDKVIKLFRGVSYQNDTTVGFVIDGGELGTAQTTTYDGGIPSTSTFAAIYDGGSPYDSPGATESLLWEQQVGEFYLDDIDAPHFPHVVSVTMRDATKKLLQAKFAQSTTFPNNHPIEEVIRAIALAGGIPLAKMDLPLTGLSTTREFMFDRTTERWKAIKEIAQAYNYDIFFRGVDGKLTMEPFRDPANPGVSPVEYTFQTGWRGPRNGDIAELDPNGDADWWVYDFENAGAPVHSVETDLQHTRSSEYSLKIVNPGLNDGGAFATEAFPVAVGEVWEVAMWSKANKNTAGKYLRVLFGNTPTFTRAQALSLVDVGGSAQAFSYEWEEEFGYVTIPAGATHMRLAPYAWTTGAAYTAWFADFSADRVEPYADTQGNLIGYRKKTGSSRIYNHVVVTGESAGTVPVYAEAENNEPTSPTRISELGRRTYFYTSAFLTTVPQCQAVADRFLQIHALEQFEVSLESFTVFYLDAMIIAEFIDPDAAATDPTRFLFTDFTIPLQPGSMSGSAKRITVVG